LGLKLLAKEDLNTTILRKEASFLPKKSKEISTNSSKTSRTNTTTKRSPQDKVKKKKRRNERVVVPALVQESMSRSTREALRGPPSTKGKTRNDQKPNAKFFASPCMPLFLVYQCLNYLIPYK
jgi:hypothetical protein